MANYVGAKCPVCDKAFTDTDDIVVCPICGTPHHRACYQALGKCACDSLHAQGHTWQAPQSDSANPTGHKAAAGNGDTSSGGEQQNANTPVRYCPTCGKPNPITGIFCQSCGTRLDGNTEAASVSYTSAFGGVSPNEEIAGVSARDLALYVGTGSHYFLPRFRIIDKGGPVTFNLPALFFNFLYFFYRKMYAVGFVLLGIYALLQIPSLLIMPELMSFYAEHFEEIMMGSDILTTFVPQHFLWVSSMAPFLRAIPVVISVMLAMFGNRIYLASAIRNIQKIKGICEKIPTGFDDQVYCEMLARRGRTSFGTVVIVCVCILVAYVILSYILVLPHIGTIYTAIENMLT